MTTLRQAAQPVQPEPDIKALQAEGKGPAPCARFCESRAFETEIRRLKRECDEYQKAADKMAAEHKVERDKLTRANKDLIDWFDALRIDHDALMAAGRLALDMCVGFSRAPMTPVKYLNLLRTIGALKQAGVTE